MSTPANSMNKEDYARWAVDEALTTHPGKPIEAILKFLFLAKQHPGTYWITQDERFLCFLEAASNPAQMRETLLRLAGITA
jgi:hypothetical protein